MCIPDEATSSSTIIKKGAAVLALVAGSYNILYLHSHPGELGVRVS